MQIRIILNLTVIVDILGHVKYSIMNAEDKYYYEIKQAYIACLD